MQDYPQYRPKQKWIHWLSAVITILISLIMFIKIQAAYVLGGMSQVFLLHKSFGVVIFILTVWRIVVVIQDKVPDVLPEQAKFQRALSKSVQGMLYILLVILPLSGYLMSGHSLEVFGIISIPAIDMPDDWYSFFHAAHKVCAYILILLLILHITGALYHYFCCKDKVLQSML
ncbi:hypothetical protein A9G13_07210 [Gilliamella sp. wkB178]|uniref:cytochrome b n=1 Tax=Gilliamella sp. wkB178 TaxID=3120259 RepID=UPI00080EA927|nr:cytochrome b/b6 domain-containing protein [Gilliamella apicola]OCG07983.1 hypothetical protein A9G13_07210 [Gilliamella apicola]